jgi:polar amino acid transport system substrate-binding protein
MTTGLFATQARQRVALFSRPIWALPDGLLVRSEDVRRIHGYRSLVDDKALTLAVIRDQVQHQTALGLGVGPDRITVFETYIDAAQAVRDGQVSAYASVARAHDGYLQQNDDLDLASVLVPASEKLP